MSRSESAPVPGTPNGRDTASLTLAVAMGNLTAACELLAEALVDFGELWTLPDDRATVQELAKEMERTGATWNGSCREWYESQGRQAPLLLAQVADTDAEAMLHAMRKLPDRRARDVMPMPVRNGNGTTQAVRTLALQTVYCSSDKNAAQWNAEGVLPRREYQFHSNREGPKPTSAYRFEHVCPWCGGHFVSHRRIIPGDRGCCQRCQRERGRP